MSGGLQRLYEPMAYGPEPVAQSFWATTATAPECPPLAGATACDTAIIGAGYTGLNAALALARAGQDVVVLDARQPGWGASGRNGGFCCIGGAKCDADTITRRFGADDTAAYMAAERAAVDHVAALLQAQAIDADTHSDGETLVAHTPSRVAGLREDVAYYQHHYGLTPSFLPRAALAEHGLSSPEFHAAMTVPVGFALNPLKYASGLTDTVRAAGARIHGASAVTGLSRAPDGRHVLRTAQGEVTARNLIIATNGYSSENLPDWLRGRFLPVQSAILVTRPLTEAERLAQGWTSHQMCYDSRNLLHYFRLMPDNRMLFGLRAAYRVTPATHAATRMRARADFDRIFPEWRHVETPHYWSGLICMSRSLTPFAGPIPGLDNAYAALCYHGNGVAMGSYAGALLAAQITGSGPAAPAVMTHPLRRFELGTWRRLLLPLVYGWYGVQDRL